MLTLTLLVITMIVLAGAEEVRSRRIAEADENIIDLRAE
jgi:hypothetical protein